MEKSPTPKRQGPEDPGRRDFLKKTAAGLIAATAVAEGVVITAGINEYNERKESRHSVQVKVLNKKESTQSRPVQIGESIMPIPISHYEVTLLINGKEEKIHTSKEHYDKLTIGETTSVVLEETSRMGTQIMEVKK